jgi:hypothetical protein
MTYWTFRKLGILDIQEAWWRGKSLCHNLLEEYYSDELASGPFSQVKSSSHGISK